jgi:hypothetical protein
MTWRRSSGSLVAPRKAFLEAFLAAAAAALAPGGAIVVQGNVSPPPRAFWYDDGDGDGDDEDDDVDNDNHDDSVARSQAYTEAVFAAAGLEVVAVESPRAGEWPDDLMPIRTWMLRRAAAAAAGPWNCVCRFPFRLEVMRRRRNGSRRGAADGRGPPPRQGYAPVSATQRCRLR